MSTIRAASFNSTAAQPSEIHHYRNSSVASYITSPPKHTLAVIWLDERRNSKDMVCSKHIHGRGYIKT